LHILCFRPKRETQKLVFAHFNNLKQNFRWRPQFIDQRQQISHLFPRKLIDQLQMEEFMPTAKVQEDIIADLAHIVPRVVVHHMKPYKEFKNAVVYHIPHEYTNEMSKNSEIVSQFTIIK
jgi:hypothetical protein